MAFKSILSAGSRLIYLSSMLLGRHVACCMFLSFLTQSKVANTKFDGLDYITDV